MASFSDVKKAAEAAFSKADHTQLLQLRLQQPQESENYALVNSFVERSQAAVASAST